MNNETDTVGAMMHAWHDFLQPSSYRVTHRLTDINDLPAIADDYDLIILDRDETVQPHHGAKRAPVFEETLKALAPKIEMLSNASPDDLVLAGKLYSHLFPVSNLLQFADTPNRMSLIRIINGTIEAWHYHPRHHHFIGRRVIPEDRFTRSNVIAKQFKKPDPRTITTIIDANIQCERIPKQPRVLMVGDRYLNDIVGGNRAGVDTALVRPYKPLREPIGLIMERYLFDKPIGAMMSRLGN